MIRTILEITCLESCENWLWLDEHQPRRQANGCGFTFYEMNYTDAAYFACEKCGKVANAKYIEADFYDDETE